MGKATVFVIDDDQSVRVALSRLIRSVGLEVNSCSSAREFLALDHPGHPSCIVLDVRLPGLSGLDLQQELIKRDREIPIIFITGHGDVPMSVRAMKLGAVDFLQKPFNDRELLDSIDRALAVDRQTELKSARRAEIKRRLDRLTPRERDVLKLVVAGRANKIIAAELGISEKTVKVHRGRVMEKMEANSLPDLVRLAEEVGICGPNH